MKRMLKFLARLYPSSWRERYAAEFEALLEEKPARARDVFDVILGALRMQLSTWSFVRITLSTALFGLMAALAISFAIPAKYVSQSLILMNRGTDATGHPNANLAHDDIDPILRGLMEKAFTKSALAQIIQKYKLYPRESTSMSPDAAVNQMRKDINIRPIRSNPPSAGLPGFVLYFSYSDPHTAQQVDADLVSLWTAANLRIQIGSATGDGPASQGETIFVPDPASLPQKPTFPKHGLFGAGGLLIGLAVGLMLACVVRIRMRMPTANG